MGDGLIVRRGGGAGKSAGQYVWKKGKAGSLVFLNYVVSDDETAYPEDGVHTDGYHYKLEGEPSHLFDIVTWGGGTDEQIAAMIHAADMGEIDLTDYWSVGDERTVSLSAMSDSIGVDETHAAQTVQLVLMHAGGYELNTATEGGKTTCNFIVGMKDCLKETGCMVMDGSNKGSWDGTNRRRWCNNTFYNAIPSTLRGIFKQFKTITAATYNGTSLQTSIDYFALPAEKEIFGGTSPQFSNSTEYNALFQFDWYKTKSNRIKKTNGSAGSWWASPS